MNVGITLALHQGSPGEYKRSMHVVKEGETLTSIAKQYDVPEYVLVSLNNTQSNEILYPGKNLILPPQIS